MSNFIPPECARVELKIVVALLGDFSPSAGFERLIPMRARANYLAKRRGQNPTLFIYTYNSVHLIQTANILLEATTFFLNLNEY